MILMQEANFLASLHRAAYIFINPSCPYNRLRACQDVQQYASDEDVELREAASYYIQAVNAIDDRYREFGELQLLDLWHEYLQAAEAMDEVFEDTKAAIVQAATVYRDVLPVIEMTEYMPGLPEATTGLSSTGDEVSAQSCLATYTKSVLTRSLCPGALRVEDTVPRKFAGGSQAGRQVNPGIVRIDEDVRREQRVAWEACRLQQLPRSDHHREGQVSSGTGGMGLGRRGLRYVGMRYSIWSFQAEIRSSTSLGTQSAAQSC